MTDAKHHKLLFGKGVRDNIMFTLDAGETMTCHFKDDGTNDAKNRYYNLNKYAHRVAITVNQVASITHIGNQELKFPRSLGTTSVNTWREGIEWEKITVRADVNNTTFEIYVS